METLVLKNFLVIKDASLDVKKFNIIIFVSGSQKYSKHGFVIKKILQTVLGTFMMQDFFL